MEEETTLATSLSGSKRLLPVMAVTLFLFTAPAAVHALVTQVQADINGGFGPGANNPPTSPELSCEETTTSIPSRGCMLYGGAPITATGSVDTGFGATSTTWTGAASQLRANFNLTKPAAVLVARVILILMADLAVS